MAENSPIDISTWIRKLGPNFKDFIAPYGFCCIFPVDTVFFLPLICVLNPKNPKILFSLHIQNDVAQPVWTLEHPKCFFQLK